ncbi:MAG: hypothetical protein A2Y17_11115 [Clostridiales bacterium GWF2_38_85]|nr:MAG: hypothetical protein A2Y17_11115 [Clostridiales bacterium GWF2_38_85]HBL84675.1 hypothetical protein [Clostridiales bacterium]
MTKQEQTNKWLSLIYPEYENIDNLIYIIRYNLWYKQNSVIMTKQEQAKRWLSLIYPENNDVEINLVYLKVYTKSEILESFSHFRGYMIELFKEISEGNIDFLFPLHCIFAVISAIANSSKFNGNVLLVDINALKERLRKPKKADKDAVINLLKDNGFIFNGDVFSSKEQSCSIEFPDDNLVLKGLYFYSITQDYDINQGMNSSYPYNQQMHILLNPRLFEYTNTNKMPFIIDDLFRYFDGEEEKEAIKHFHIKMLEYGYSFNFYINIFENRKEFKDIYLRYDYKKHDARAIVRVNLDNHIPSIGIKMQDMRKYNDYVEKCSDEFKYSLNILWDDCVEDNCKQKEHKEPCKHRLEYTLYDTQYCKCTYECWQYKWNQTIFMANKNDIETYLYFVRENDIRKKATIK